MKNAIEVHGLQKRYGQTVAVDRLTFNVAAGDLLSQSMHSLTGILNLPELLESFFALAQRRIKY